MIPDRLARVGLALAGTCGGALVGLFLGGPAVLADGSGAERAWVVATAAVAWTLLAGALAFLARTPLAGAAVALGGLPIVVLLMIAEPETWPVGAALLAGMTAGVAVGTAAGTWVRGQRAGS